VAGSDGDEVEGALWAVIAVAGRPTFVLGVVARTYYVAPVVVDINEI
jgi:hypothetical protein